MIHFWKLKKKIAHELKTQFSCKIFKVHNLSLFAWTNIFIFWNFPSLLDFFFFVLKIIKTSCVNTKKNEFYPDLQITWFIITSFIYLFKHQRKPELTNSKFNGFFSCILICISEHEKHIIHHSCGMDSLEFIWRFTHISL
jgi:hypothetical protein